MGLALALGTCIAVPVRACTIFVLADTNRVLFCNNEDWTNRTSRVWFVPAGPKHYGCAYVGFDDGWPFGGLNTAGLAFDWVAGWREAWKPDPGLPGIERMEQLPETCATVEEAIAFYRGHREPSFSWGKVVVADRTGASAIIGAKDGKLKVERSRQSRGFGYGGRILGNRLAESPAPTVANGVGLLRACMQKGRYATKYSNIYDLRSGDIFLFRSPIGDAAVKFNLAAELKKGAHYYDMPHIHEQMTQAPRPLPASIERRRRDKSL